MKVLMLEANCELHLYYMNLSRWCPTVAKRVQQRIDLLMHRSCITVLIEVGLVIHSFNNADIYFFII